MNFNFNPVTFICMLSTLCSLWASGDEHKDTSQISPSYSVNVSQSIQGAAIARLPKDLMLYIMKFLSPDDRSVLYLIRYFLDEELALSVLIEFIGRYNIKHGYYPALNAYPGLIKAHFCQYSKRNPHFDSIFARMLKHLIGIDYQLYYDLCKGAIADFEAHMQQDSKWQALSSLLRESQDTIVQKAATLHIGNEPVAVKDVLILLKKYRMLFLHCFKVAQDQKALLRGDMQSHPVILSSGYSSLGCRFLVGMCLFFYLCYRLDVIHSPLYVILQECLFLSHEHLSDVDKFVLIERLILLGGFLVVFLQGPLLTPARMTTLRAWRRLGDRELPALCDALKRAICFLENEQQILGRY